MKYETIFVCVKDDGVRYRVDTHKWAGLLSACHYLLDITCAAKQRGTTVILAAVQSIEDA